MQMAQVCNLRELCAPGYRALHSLASLQVLYKGHQAGFAGPNGHRLSTIALASVAL
jgi:hypothetical protein